ncbi:MAG TPA: GAF domain-containing protein, partial [Burkholderiales bacterium]|nr:GAF domain-containing protein [Burkholderiales bacterium]
MLDVFKWVEELNHIGTALSAEEDIGLLLHAILVAAKNIVNSDGGTLYRVINGELILFETLVTDSLGIAMGGATGNEITLPAIRLYDENGKPNNSHVVAYSVLNDRTVNIRDAYAEAGFDLAGTREFDRMTGYRSESFLTVPMKNHEKEIIGVLQLINAKDRKTGETVGFSASD